LCVGNFSMIPSLTVRWRVMAGGSARNDACRRTCLHANVPAAARE
jgi:hypothetical protein